MVKYEYKFISLEKAKGLKVKRDETFEKCKEIIAEEGEKAGALRK
ncbi:hypothetical protein [Anaerosphaera multitolerans]|nr:hypothetical protein [Anaerosphaera multitolerans]